MSAPKIAPTGPTEDRRTYLGASDIGAVAGLNPYKTALDVWAEKTGVAVQPDDAARARMRTGIVLERPVLEQLYGPVQPCALAYPGTLRGAEPWIAATPDAVATPPGDVWRRDRTPNPRAWAVEVKIVGLRAAARWDDGGGEVPPEVYCQAQWQLGVLGLPRAHVVALLGTELRIVEIARDEDALAGLVDIGRDFWRRSVEGGEMPAPDGSERARHIVEARWRRADAGLVEMTAVIASAARAYVEARRRALDADTDKNAAANALRVALGAHEGAAGDGLKVTWKEQRGPVDWEAYATALGGTEPAADAYRREDTRVLRVIVKGAGR